MLKVTDYLRSMDSKIGNPINTFDVLFNHVYKNVFENTSGTLNKFFLYFEFFKLKFGFWINSIRYRQKIKNVEIVDLSYESRL